MDIKLLPLKPGVYIMKSQNGEILYIGKANSLRKRVSQYFKGTYGLQEGWKIPNLTALVKKIDYIICRSERDALILEQKLIKQHRPFFNKMWKDDKTYPYVKLTLNEDFPRVFLTRKKTTDGALYFGPYPKTAAVKKLLRYLWKIGFVNLRPCKWEFSLKKPLERAKIESCIYFHTFQCPAPCAKRINRSSYRRIAKRAEYIFEGKFEQLKKNFKRKMATSTKKLKFEESAKYRDFLIALKHISEKIQVSKYSDKNILKSIEKTNALSMLAEILKLKKTPFHIEAFDTSHLFGKESVGAMVCFKEAQKNHSHYRRFKIKKAKTIDDFAMINEIVTRRIKGLKLSKESLPDLFLIDGGKGQLSAAKEALKKEKLTIPVIALAKRCEEIFVCAGAKSIKLKKTNPGLKLLMEMRDEVHRFAVTYHRSLRNKKLIKGK